MVMKNGKLNGFNDGLHPSSGIGGGQSASEMTNKMDIDYLTGLVPYKLALLLKAKGFNCKCIGNYSTAEGWTMDLSEGSLHKVEHTNSESNYYSVSAPFYQQVVDWFRVKHKYVLCVFQETDFGMDTDRNPTYTCKWNWEIVRLGTFEPAYDCQFGVVDEYYQGWYEAVKMALTLIP
jgi:hypothetical protein